MILLAGWGYASPLAGGTGFYYMFAPGCMEVQECPADSAFHSQERHLAPAFASTRPC